MSCTASAKADCRRKFDQHVYVVLHPADLVHEYVLLMANAREIRPRSRLFFFRNQFASVFGAEDNVDEILNERVSQWGLFPRMEYFTEAANLLCRA